MHIENTIRLDFKDVLIRPKRSTLTSRSEVDITREFKFLHSPVRYNGIPIIAANMDTTGTFDMARALAKHGLSTALHKHYAVEDYVDFFTKLEAKHTAFYSLGIGNADWEKFQETMRRSNNAVQYVCIDVANGYTETFVAFVKKVREAYPELVIMAGNVVTGDMTEELLLAGADIVKVGIGPGFRPYVPRQVPVRLSFRNYKSVASGLHAAPERSGLFSGASGVQIYKHF